MKFISHGLGVTPQIWLLSNDMVKAVESSGIGLDLLSKLPLHQDKISDSDIIAIAVVNYGMSLKLGSPDTSVFDDDSFVGAKGEVLRKRIQSTLADIPKLSLLQAYNAPSQFYVKSTQSGFIICQGEDKPKEPTWIETGENYFGNALLRCIYDVIGFYKVHFKDVTCPQAGEFSLANVFRNLA